jgi:hypothetical protein
MKLFQFLGLAMPVLVNALAATDEPQSAVCSHLPPLFKRQF